MHQTTPSWVLVVARCQAAERLAVATRLEFHRVAPKHRVSQRRSRRTVQIRVRGKGNRRGLSMGRDTGWGKNPEETIQEVAAWEVAPSVVAASEVAASVAATSVVAHSRVLRATCCFCLGLGPCSDLGPDLSPGPGPPHPGSSPYCLERRGYPGCASSSHPDYYPMRQNDHLRLANCLLEVRAPVGPKLMSCRGSCNPSI